MNSTGASGVLGAVESGLFSAKVKPCLNTLPCWYSSSMMIPSMGVRSLGSSMCFGGALPVSPHSTTISTPMLCQAPGRTLRVASSRTYHGQSVDNTWNPGRHYLSSAFENASSTAHLVLNCNYLSPTSAKAGRGKSRLSVQAQVRHPNFVHELDTGQHSTGENKDPLAPVNSTTQERLGPEFSFVEPNGTPSLSAEEFESASEREAWELLRSSVVTYRGSPVGTIAAQNPISTGDPLNYDQVFIRDFIPSGIAFLLKGESEIVREFLLNTLQLQSWEKTVDCYNPGQGLMPASFKVRTVPHDGDDLNAVEEILDPDFGEAAIGRVAPVDSGLWWIILLRAYGKSTGDYSLQEKIEVQTGMKMVLKLCLADGFDMFPTLLVTDGSCMIDRRMGIHGHPLEIQALFYSALRCGREMLIDEDGTSGLARSINHRLSALLFHVRQYYWLDLRKLNEIYRYQTEEYSLDAVNKFNIYPDQIPPWLLDWMPDEGGYLLGNLQPAHMDFRYYTLGNLWSVVCALSDEDQSAGILDLIEAKWTDFVGNMPLKISFPSLDREKWRIITGADPKNTPWSYHNSGSWPVLLWQFTVACIKMGKVELAQRAVEVAEKSLSKDRWPEYYDTRSGRLIGKQARLQQTWTIAGFLVAKMLIKNPEAANILTFDEDLAILEAGACSFDIDSRRGRKRMFL